MPLLTTVNLTLKLSGAILVSTVLMSCSDVPPPSTATSESVSPQLPSTLAETLEQDELMAASNLAVDARQASDLKVPVLLVVTRHDCPYCQRLKQDVLRPMLLSGEYEQRVIMRELMIDPSYSLLDFSDNPVNSNELATRYDAIFVPTVLLLDSNGREVADRILGFNAAGLYGYYLDQAIDHAAIAIRTKSKQQTQ